MNNSLDFSIQASSDKDGFKTLLIGVESADSCGTLLSRGDLADAGSIEETPRPHGKRASAAKINPYV